MVAAAKAKASLLMMDSGFLCLTGNSAGFSQSG